MANTQHVQFSDENGDIYYLENQTEDVRDASGKPLSDGGDLSEASVTFTADSTRTLPKSGSRFKAFCGSVLKFLSDLNTVSFSGSYNDLSNKPSIPSGAAASQAVANNCTTTAAGSVLDARQGKVLMDKANQLISEINAIASAVRITGVPERLGETSFAGESLTTITHKFTAPEKYFPSPFALWVNTTGWAGLILQQYSIDPDSGIVQMDFYNTRANTFTTNPRVTALFQKQLYEEMQ